MSVLWTDIAIWWLRLAVAGGLLLLAGALLVAACRTPAIRLRAGSWVFAVALILVPLTWLPGWVELPWSLPHSNNQVTREIAAVEPIPAPAGIEMSDPSSDNFGDWTAVNGIVSETSGSMPHGGPDSVRDHDAFPGGQAPTLRSTVDRPRLDWIANVLLLGYCSSVLALMIRLAIGQWRLESLWRSGSHPNARLAKTFARLTRQFHRQPALRVSERITGPICFGVFRPRIVVPTQLADFADERMSNWIIGHELDHLRRHDPLVSWLMGIGQAFFFFVPWLWRLRRDLRLNQEILADAAAVEAASDSTHADSKTSAVDYADFLVGLTCAGRLPAGAAGVKTPSSDLYRRITMLLQKTEKVETKCPRRWSLLTGIGLLSLGIGLAGLQFSTRNAAAAPSQNAGPSKKESITDAEDEIRRALESLKKGPEPKKEEKPVDLNPIDEAKKAEEALKKAQEELRKNPASDEARKAFDDAVKKFKDSSRNRVPQGQPLEFPQFPVFPQFQPIDPAEFDKEVERMNEQLQKAMEELQRQLQVQPGLFPGNGRLPLGGFRNLSRRSGDGRLGLRVERPTPILMEQLDLPANQGIVVTDVVPGSTGDKVGIKINDILIEIGGKAISSEVIELQRMLRDIKADDKVDIVLLRKGKKETLKGVSLPEARPEAQNPFNPRLIIPNLPNNPRFPNGFPPEFFGNSGSTAFSMQVVNGDYTVKFQEDGVKVTILGTKEDGTFKPSSIEVEANGKTSKAESLEKVDEAHRSLVEKLLKRIR